MPQVTVPSTEPASSSSTILVLIDEHPAMERVLQAARQRAALRNQPWIVLHVETPAYFELDDESKQRVTYFLTRGEQLGAEVHEVGGEDLLDATLHFMQTHTISQVVVGKSQRGWHSRLFRPSLVDKLLSRAPQGVELHIVSLGEPSHTPLGGWWRRLQTSSLFRGAGAVLIAYLLTELIRLSMPLMLFKISLYNISMIFLLSCVFAALRFGLIAGLVASILSFLTINFFYIGPSHEIRVDNITDFVNGVLFLVASVVAAAFGGYSRDRSEALRQRERFTNTLYNISRQVAGSGNFKDVITSLRTELERVLETGTSIFLPHEKATGTADTQLRIPKQVHLSEKDQRALKRCWQGQIPTGAFTTVEPAIYWHFEPLTTSSGRIGVLGIYLAHERYFGRSDRQLIASIADMVALALDRANISRQIEEARVTREREHLRSALLSSVSHDLKTPLASIIGSLSAIQHMGKTLSAEAKQTLFETALTEAERLNRFITNILDMTRLESAAVLPKLTQQNIDELLLRVLRRMEPQFHGRNVNFTPAADQADVWIDPAMMEQVVQNLLDNAIKYSPPGTEITITTSLAQGGADLLLSIQSGGAEIPENMKELIFDKFHRLDQKDTKVAGTGLGLAICRAIMVLHEGEIWVDSGQDGNIFRIKLPLTRPEGEAAGISLALPNH